MKVETTKLKKISNYAREKCVTAQTVYKWIDEGKISAITIDGMTFILMDDTSTRMERLK